MRGRGAVLLALPVDTPVAAQHSQPVPTLRNPAPGQPVIGDQRPVVFQVAKPSRSLNVSAGAPSRLRLSSARGLPLVS